jgi:hypothetical protein
MILLFETASKISHNRRLGAILEAGLQYVPAVFWAEIAITFQTIRAWNTIERVTIPTTRRIGPQQQASKTHFHIHVYFSRTGIP